LYRRDGKEGEDDDESEIDSRDDDDDDWRDFRAKLVMKKFDSPSFSPKSSASLFLENEEDTDGFGALFSQMDAISKSDQYLGKGDGKEERDSAIVPEIHPSQWAYETSGIVEQGTVILGGVEHKIGFGLQQQYYHKATILVIEHDEAHFTKGIILNRPSDEFITDDLNDGVKWRVSFGGDVQNFDSDEPDIVCLHSLKSPEATKSSVEIVKNIKWTSFDVAKTLVNVGLAKPSDFSVFAGYVGWGPGELTSEIHDNAWYMVATDSNTLLKELARQNTAADPREAGLETWEYIMKMIGREVTARTSVGTFDDYMLKEWARKYLSQRTMNDTAKSVNSADSRKKCVPGTLLRGSSVRRSPFLLSNQEFHKSLVLILSDDEDATIGVMLNHPAAKGLQMEVKDTRMNINYVLTAPLRVGGDYVLEESESPIWLHNSPKLRGAQVGTPIGGCWEHIWQCTYEEVAVALTDNLAKLDEFLVISGITLWPKGDIDAEENFGEMLEDGSFEIVPPSCVESVWNSLLKQRVLTERNIQQNIDYGIEAWSAGEGDSLENDDDNFDIHSIGMGYEEEEDSFVFNTDVKVAKLSDDALRVWVSSCLLGIADLGDDLNE